MKKILKIVVWIIGIVLVTVFIAAGFSEQRLVSVGNRTTETTRLVLQIHALANELKKKAGDYTGVSFHSDAADERSIFVQQKLLRIGQKNPFNGAIEINPVPSDASFLYLRLDKIKKPGCQKLAIVRTSDFVPLRVIINGSGTDLKTKNIASNAALCDRNENTIEWVLN